VQHEFVERSVEVKVLRRHRNDANVKRLKVMAMRTNHWLNWCSKAVTFPTAILRFELLFFCFVSSFLAV